VVAIAGRATSETDEARRSAKRQEEELGKLGMRMDAEMRQLSQNIGGRIETGVANGQTKAEISLSALRSRIEQVEMPLCYHYNPHRAQQSFHSERYGL
jgi:hypothetical protein